jgi:hypothetical protein
MANEKEIPAISFSFLKRGSYMLVAFFKSHAEQGCECNVVKFVDRIWIDKSANLTCIRTFIINLKDNSLPLTEIRMLVPFRQIAEFEDISETCLLDDYLFNGRHFSTGGYEIRSLDIDRTNGIVNYDFFEAVVYTTNIIKAYECPKNPNCRVIAINMKTAPIKPGEFRLIRIKFKITSVLDEVFPRVYNLELNYFDNSLVYGTYDLLEIKNLEIPVIKLMESDNKKGGFDIFVHLPEDLSSTNFNALTQTTSDHLPDGTLSTRRFQKFIWRARKVIREDVNLLKAGETPIRVEGLVNDPYELEEIRREIGFLKENATRLQNDTEKLQNDTCKIKSGYKIARIIAICAVIIALISLLFGEAIKNIVRSCFNG